MKVPHDLDRFQLLKQKGTVLKFLRKIWEISACMFELIMVLSAVLGEYSDLVMVSAYGVNAVSGLMHEMQSAPVIDGDLRAANHLPGHARRGPALATQLSLRRRSWSA